MLGDISHVTAPYADDFCLITTHLTSHQKIINDIHAQISSMGMKLKPPKCRSLSIKGLRPEVVTFHIGHNEIASIRYEEQKFLGKLVIFKVIIEETYTLIKHIH